MLAPPIDLTRRILVCPNKAQMSKFSKERRPGMKKTVLFTFMVICVLALALGCTVTNRMADMTVISTKNISSLKNAQRMGTFGGKTCMGMLFAMGKVPDMEDAIDQALEQGKGNAMVDAVIYSDLTHCAGTPLTLCYRVKGTVIRTKDFMYKGSMDHVYDLVASGEYDPPQVTQKNDFTYVFLKKTGSTDLDNVQLEYFDVVLRLKK
jgi:hypothetical protein